MGEKEGGRDRGIEGSRDRGGGGWCGFYTEATEGGGIKGSRDQGIEGGREDLLLVIAGREGL